jgi:hypothetical protein
MDSTFAAENPLSLLKTRSVDSAPVAVMSFFVITNSSAGDTSNEYSLSSAFYKF